MSEPKRIADAWKIEQFRDQFVMLYQNTEKLAGMTNEVRNIVGDVYKIPTLDEAEMRDRGAYGSLIPVTPLDHDRKTINLVEKILDLAVDKGEQQLTNVDERSALAKIHANALGRQKDQFKLNALYDGAGYILPDGGTNLTVAKLREIRAKFVDENAPDTELYIAIGASQLSSLLAEQEVTSSDFNTVKALVNGDIDTFMGFKFIKFGRAKRGVGGLAYTETGSPATSRIRHCLAWQKESTWFATGLDGFEGFWWSGERHSWLSTSCLQAGAKVVLPEGVIQVDCEEIPQP